MGLSWLNSNANLPFNEMRQVFVPLKREKRYPRPLAHYFKIAKLLRKVTFPRRLQTGEPGEPRRFNKRC